jgi:phosphotransacetylase
VTLGLVEPLLLGAPDAILALCRELDWAADPAWIIPTASDAESAARAVTMVRHGEADVLMKGNIHTDLLLRAVLDTDSGLRLPGRRVSHVFLVDVPGHDRLIGITDAAINIAPDLTAKAEICQNAIDLFHILGITEPRVAVLSAVETVTSAIASTLDAACLTLMARRGQITGAQVDGPLAFDNAISAHAAIEKDILSDVAGQADILLVPDLVSGNILAKALEYLGRAVAAGVAIGLSAPVVLTSRADPAPARMASLAVAALMHRRATSDKARLEPPEGSAAAAPQPEHSCCPPSAATVIRQAAE